jgi:hypothetical protein
MLPVKFFQRDGVTNFLSHDKRVIFVFARAVAFTFLLTLGMSAISFFLRLANCGWTNSCVPVVSIGLVHDITFIFLLAIVPIVSYALVLSKMRPLLPLLHPYLAILFPCWIGYVAMKLTAIRLSEKVTLLPQTTLEYVLISAIVFSLAMVTKHFLWKRS